LKSASVVGSQVVVTPVGIRSRAMVERLIGQLLEEMVREVGTAVQGEWARTADVIRSRVRRR
jgi:hypothetical protein